MSRSVERWIQTEEGDSAMKGRGRPQSAHGKVVERRKEGGRKVKGNKKMYKVGRKVIARWSKGRFGG
jgi:hypothetical protein